MQYFIVKTKQVRLYEKREETTETLIETSKSAKHTKANIKTKFVAKQKQGNEMILVNYKTSIPKQYTVQKKTIYK